MKRHLFMIPAFISFLLLPSCIGRPIDTGFTAPPKKEPVPSENGRELAYCKSIEFDQLSIEQCRDETLPDAGQNGLRFVLTFTIPPDPEIKGFETIGLQLVFPEAFEAFLGRNMTAIDHVNITQYSAPKQGYATFELYLHHLAGQEADDFLASERPDLMQINIYYEDEQSTDAYVHLTLPKTREDAQTAHLS